MLDINLFRSDLSGVAAGLAKRGVTLDTLRFEALEARRKDIQVRTQELQQRRNALSKQVGSAKSKGEDAAPILAEVAGLSDAVKRLETALDEFLRGVRTSYAFDWRPLAQTDEAVARTSRDQLLEAALASGRITRAEEAGTW